MLVSLPVCPTRCINCANPPAVDPVPRCPYFPACGKLLLNNTSLSGGTLPGGTVTGKSIVECCNACARRGRACRAFTFDPAKDVVSWGWNRGGAGLQPP